MLTRMKYLAVALLIAVSCTSVYAGRRAGPGKSCTRVEANSSDWFETIFVGGEVARIAVIGDGDTDLDLYVYDENDNLIASDTDSTDDCVVRWTPKWTGPFRIKVRNLGSVYNNYCIYAN